MKQLSRIIAGGSLGTQDEQAAPLDDRGSYDELTEEIDRLLAEPPPDERERPAS